MAKNVTASQGEDYYKKWKDLVYLRFPVEAAQMIKKEEMAANDPAERISVVEDQFGYIHNETIRRFTLTNYNRMSVQVITYGAAITTLHVPDRTGRVDDIILGYDGIHGYLMKSNPHFGAVVGRVSNRIRSGRITVAGQTFQLSKNKLGHHLNGGFRGFDKAIWDSHVQGNKVIFSYLSQDGEEGYPGEVMAHASYELTPDNKLILEMTATTNKPTPINMSNHTYFNLAGHQNATAESLYDHTMVLYANSYLPTDQAMIPTGKIQFVYKTPMDFQSPVSVGRAITAVKGCHKRNGIDHTFVSEAFHPNTKRIAQFYHKPSGRCLNVITNQPCVHVYTANNLPIPRHRDQLYGKGRMRYNQHCGFCLMTQQFPDGYYDESSNRTMIIKPGEVYCNKVVYQFGEYEQEKNNWA